jgi:3-methyladenine DNA glycosylase AlkD
MAARTNLANIGAESALVRLKRLGSKPVRDRMAARYGIVTKDETFGVSMAQVQKLAKDLGHDHDLAAALWATSCYEARMLAIYVEEPARVTAAQMDRWARDFDNWAVCDTACFKLFDRTPHAWTKVATWTTRREEFVKRAAFALLASIALHDKGADDARFVRALDLVEGAATDERNFVKKGVNWALRAIGGRNAKLNTAAAALAGKLAASGVPSARWIGKDALKALSKKKVRQ